jgi:hypothetical protein
MKAEHRHQLHTNALADRMGRLLKEMRSAPTSTSRLVWVFALLVVVTFLVWWLYAYGAVVRDRSALWTNVAAATHAPSAGPAEDVLQRIARDNPTTIPGRTAGFELARSQLQQGLQLLASDNRKEALALLKAARERYRELAPGCIDVPLLAQEALMGKATAEESLAGMVEPPSTEETGEKSAQPKEENYAGSLDKALEYYRDLAIKFPDSILGKKAEKRANELEQQRSLIDQFYAEANKKAAPLLSTPIKGK